MMSTLSYTLGQLAAHVGAEVRGDEIGRAHV